MIKRKRILAIILVVLVAMVLILVGISGGKSVITGILEKVTGKNSAIKTKIGEEVHSYLEDGKFSGYVLVSKDNEIIYEKGIGKADYKREIDNTRTTKFNIASVTKQFTSFAVMQLQEKKMLKVEDTINKYLPDFPYGNKITIHQLLSHTSGLPEHPDAFDIRLFRALDNNSSNKTNNDKVKLAFDPGTNYSYSNTGYVLLGYIVEKVSGKPLDEYFKDNIFTPLQMKETSYLNEKYTLDKLAVGYLSENKDVAPVSWSDLNVGNPRGSSGLCSTAADLLLWENALNEQKLIANESYGKMYHENMMQYGYGWFIGSCEGEPTYYHYGIGSGYRSYVYRRPSDQLTVIVLSNNGNYDLSYFAQRLENATLEQ